MLQIATVPTATKIMCVRIKIHASLIGSDVADPSNANSRRDGARATGEKRTKSDLLEPQLNTELLQASDNFISVLLLRGGQPRCCRATVNRN